MLVAEVDAVDRLAHDERAGDLVGTPYPDVGVRVAGDGEVWISGPGLARGYLGGKGEHADESTGAATELPTGDLGRVDETGRLVLLGRRKEMLIRGGTNIYPALYEAPLAAAAGLEAAFLVGVPEASGNERVVLVGVPLANARPEQARRRLDDLARSHDSPLDDHARPDAVVVLPAVPRSGRSEKPDRAAIARVVLRGGPQPTILPLDLAHASSDEFDHVAGAMRAQLGRLDGVVHSAVKLGSLGPIEHQSFDAWLEVLRVNVGAAMALTRATLPLLADAPDASVVFTLDTRGLEPRAYWGAYAASKAALWALAATLADEWDERANLRINAVVPGAVHSPFGAMLQFEGHNRIPDTFTLQIAPPGRSYLCRIVSRSGHEMAVIFT
jgi:NAD(P)-dependent dehydrogenase (short-subunit alcohol dehydrogenase family)